MNNGNYQDNKINFNESYFYTKEDYNIENLSEVFLYLESYKAEIIILSEVFCHLTSYLSNTFDKVKKIIKSKIISRRNPSYKIIVNGDFYILKESLLK